MGGTRPEDAHDLFLHLGNDRHRSLPRVYVALPFILRETAREFRRIILQEIADCAVKYDPIASRVKSVTRVPWWFFTDSAWLYIRPAVDFRGNVDYETECGRSPS